jgi:hypothetical protein
MMNVNKHINYKQDDIKKSDEINEYYFNSINEILKNTLIKLGIEEKYVFSKIYVPSTVDITRYTFGIGKAENAIDLEIRICDSGVLISFFTNLSYKITYQCEFKAKLETPMVEFNLLERIPRAGEDATKNNDHYLQRNIKLLFICEEVKNKYSPYANIYILNDSEGNNSTESKQLKKLGLSYKKTYLYKGIELHIDIPNETDILARVSFIATFNYKPSRNINDTQMRTQDCKNVKDFIACLDKEFNTQTWILFKSQLIEIEDKLDNLVFK